MILKASKVSSVRHAGTLSKHLQKTNENERVEVKEIRGTARPDDLEASLKSMQRASELTKGKTGLYHVAISPRSAEGKEMSKEQWNKCIQAVEKEFGLEKQPMAIVEHVKEGRTHIHAVWQLTDTDKRKLISISHDYAKLNKIGRELEKDLSHQRTTSERSGKSYTISEQQLAKRTKEDIPKRRELFKTDWEKSKTGQEFRERLERRGYTITEGERAKYVAVSKSGDVINLARELGVKVRDIEQRFSMELTKPLQPVKAIQTEVKEKREKVKAINQVQSREQPQPAKEATEDIAKRRELFKNDWEKSKTANEFRERLDRRGYIITQGEKEKEAVIKKNGDVISLTKELGIQEKAIEARLRELSKPLQPTMVIQNQVRTLGERAQQDYNKRVQNQKEATKSTENIKNEDRYKDLSDLPAWKRETFELRLKDMQTVRNNMDKLYGPSNPNQKGIEVSKKQREALEKNYNENLKSIYDEIDKYREKMGKDKDNARER